MNNLIHIIRDLLIIVYLNRAMHLSQYEQAIILLAAFATAYWLENK